MEDWSHDHPTIKGFANHWETDKPLPEEKILKLYEQKVFNTGMMVCQQLCFGQMDMELHGNYDPEEAGEKGDGPILSDVQKEIASKYVPHAMPLDTDQFLCAFSHIFAGGYSVGYYSYKWAEVMSADAFGAFEDVNIDNEEEVKNVGKTFGEKFLRLGGGTHQ